MSIRGAELPINYNQPFSCVAARLPPIAGHYRHLSLVMMSSANSKSQPLMIIIFRGV